MKKVLQSQLSRRYLIFRGLTSLMFLFLFLFAFKGIAQISISFSTVEPTCHGMPDGSATATASNGTAPYNYAWSTGATGALLSGIAGGTYSVTVTDAASNTAIQSVFVSEPPLVTFSFDYDACSVPFDLAVIPGGGVPPYGYHWTNGNMTSSLSNIPAGTYCVTVVDSHNCGTTDCITLNGTPLVIDASATPVSCYGGSNGAASVTATSGVAPYSYTWSNGGDTQNLNNISAGVYSVTVTDANGCSAVDNVTVTEPMALHLQLNSQNVTCNGDQNGSVSVMVTGGTPAYSYAWSNGANTASILGLPQGTYTVTVTDGNGCVETGMVSIFEPASINIETSIQNITCNGSNDGSASAIVTGGMPPYSYSWSNGAVSPTITGLSAGNYGLTVTDANGCDEITSISITQPATTINLQLDHTNLSCYISDDGTASVTASGGTPAYSYLWSTGSTSTSITNLSAGIYSVTVTDANGCTQVGSVTITQPTSLIIDVVGSDIGCFGGDNGSATVTVTGGTPAYTYLWSNGATSATISGLLAGSYTVSVIDNNGCTQQVSVIINEPTALTLQNTKQDVSCFGGNDGSATVMPSGGTAPYSYLWSNGATTMTITNLTVGTYSVVVTDANGCSESLSVDIAQPASTLELQISSQDVLCYNDNNGSATVTVSGGVPGYTYIWSNGATTNSITDLSPGTYTVIVTDANGCTGQASVTIMQAPSLSLVVSSNDVTCNGYNDGSATVTVSGGSPGYTFNWSNGATTATATNLTAGTYTVVVTDTHGCTEQASVTINQPTPIVLQTSSNDVICNGGNDGSATVTASGGSPGYTYSWSNGATTATVTGLAAGTYTVVVTDTHGCMAQTSVTINQPMEIVLQTSSNDITCNGDNDGSATVNANGGTPGYTYSWSNGANTATVTGLAAGTYTVVVTDAHGCTAVAAVTISQPTQIVLQTNSSNVSCNGANDGSATVLASGGTPGYTYNWSNGANTATVTGLTAGTYIVVVTDTHGCTEQTSITIEQPAPLFVNLAVTNIYCSTENSGVISATVTGGTPGYTYQWSNGANTSFITNLAAGTYSLTVTDTHGCSIVVEETVIQTLPLVVTINETDVSCNGADDGTVTATVLNAISTAPYTYIWSNGATTQSISGLEPGSYDVTVTDVNGCYGTDWVTISEPTAITLTTSQQNISCNGNNDGTASVVASGGTPGYTYSWSNGANTPTATGLIAGTYIVTVTDNHGCSEQAIVVIGEPTALIVNAAGGDVSCYGENDGYATATVIGGTAPYSYQWSNGVMVANNVGLEAGTYTVVVTDAHGCINQSTVVISQPTELVVTYSVTDASCNGGSDGTITTVVSGGTAPYSYIWSTGATTSNVTDLPKGNYDLTVTDANGCIAIEWIMVMSPSEIVMEINSQDVACYGGANGFASATVSGGTAPYTYHWSNGASTSSVNNLGAGNFGVTVTDAHGCSVSASGYISQPDALVLSISKTDVACNGEFSGSAMASVSGGTSPYSYLWSNGTPFNKIVGIQAGTYSVTVTDGNGCTSAGTVIILEPEALTVSVIEQDETCIDANDGVASFGAQGGTPPYTYEWSTGATTPSVMDLAPGVYDITVTDANGCSIIEWAHIGEATTPCYATIGDLVWIDANENGLYDTGEVGIPNVLITVTGTDINGNSVTLTTFTNLNGIWSIDVVPGTYQVTYGPINGDYNATSPNVGSDDSIDSDVIPGTMTTEPFTIGNNEINLTIDAGFVPSCDNVTNAGAIGYDQEVCGIGADADPIYNVELPTGGSGAIEYMWMMTTDIGPFNPQTWTPVPNSNSPSYDPGQIYQDTYFARCAKRAGCSTFIETSNVVAVTVGNDAALVIEGDTYICPNESVVYTAVTNTEDAVVSWMVGPGMVLENISGHQATFSFTSFGNFQISATAQENGCMVANSLDIHVSNDPVYCGSAFPIETSVVDYATREVDVFWSMSKDWTDYSYDVEISYDREHFDKVGEVNAATDVTDTQRLYDFSNIAGRYGHVYYRILAIDEQRGLEQYSEISELMISNNHKDDMNAMIYPNPVMNELNIEIIDAFDQNVTVQLFSMTGKLVMDQTFNGNENRYKLSFDGFASGTYFLRIVYGNGKVDNFKVIKN